MQSAEFMWSYTVKLSTFADETPQGITSIFFWSRGWLSLRRLLRRPSINLVVIDFFIATTLHEQLGLESRCLPHPIVPMSSVGGSSDSRRVCFVGFNTPKKGYADFEILAKVVSGFSFVAIGGGVCRDLTVCTGNRIRELSRIPL